jgi:hypothetical protein
MLRTKLETWRCLTSLVWSLGARLATPTISGVRLVSRCFLATSFVDTTGGDCSSSDSDDEVPLDLAAANGMIAKLKRRERKRACGSQAGNRAGENAVMQQQMLDLSSKPKAYYCQGARAQTL